MNIGSGVDQETHNVVLASLNGWRELRHGEEVQARLTRVERSVPELVLHVHLGGEVDQQPRHRQVALGGCVVQCRGVVLGG